MSETQAYSRLAAVYDDIVVDRCHDRWAAYLDQRWCRDPSGVRTVLDVCCGTGLFAAELIALGYQVVGVDASASMLALARQRLGRDAILFQQTLPDLTVDGTFDAAVSTFDGLNYLSPADFGATVAALARRLRVGGWLAFDMHTEAMMDFTVANPVVDGEAGGHRFLISSDVDTDARTCDTRIEITRTRDGQMFSERHRQYFLSDDQIQSALTAAAFGTPTVTDQYTEDPIDHSSLRATWIARAATAKLTGS